MTRAIALTRGQVALIDAADYAAVSRLKWHAKPIQRKAGGFYAAGLEAGRTVYLHRFLMQPGSGLVVDHIDGDGLDNRRSNLRVCTPSQNRQAAAVSSRSTTGFRGVLTRPHQIGTPCGYQAIICADRRSRTIGYFATPEEAARAYDAAAIATYGEFARLNFPGAPT